MEASEQAVIQNLKDAGCCRETVERFLALGASRLGTSRVVKLVKEQEAAAR